MLIGVTMLGTWDRRLVNLAWVREVRVKEYTNRKGDLCKGSRICFQDLKAGWLDVVENTYEIENLQYHAHYPTA